MIKHGSALILVALVASVAIGCTSSPAAITAPAAPTEAATTTAVAPTPAPPTATPAPPPDTPVPPPAALPPEPAPVEFEAADGQALQGLYYPAASDSAPLLVLVHWVGGDQHDWVEIAHWLQNRGLGGKGEKSAPWLDPSWFPPVPADQSLAVFTFSLRGCDESGCDNWTPDLWLLDAQAAMQAASELEGIDPQRIAAIGASIGADGAIDGCQWLNERQGQAQCAGALSLSPGNYFDVPYAGAVAALDAEKHPAWCLASEGDAESAPTCRSATGDAYRMIIYEGNAHGMMLLKPGLDPDTLETVLDFLALVFGT